MKEFEERSFGLSSQVIVKYYPFKYLNISLQKDNFSSKNYFVFKISIKSFQFQFLFDTFEKLISYLIKKSNKKIIKIRYTITSTPYRKSFVDVFPKKQLVLGEIEMKGFNKIKNDDSLFTKELSNINSKSIAYDKK